MSEIELKHVSLCYEDRGQRTHALSDINLTIKSGEFYCVIGPSGSGKTSLLRLLCGLNKPTSGEILINGKALAAPGPDRAVVFQNDTLFPWMTALNNVQFAIRQAKKDMSRREAKQQAMEFLRKTRMAEDAHKYPYQLSGGMQQRVAIARALAMGADTLLLDEPFGALDAKIRRELQDLLEELWYSNVQRRPTVCFITHDIQEAVRLASRVLLLAPGRIAGNIEVDLPRPRNALDDTQRIRMKQLQGELTQRLYQSSQKGDRHV